MRRDHLGQAQFSEMKDWGAHGSQRPLLATAICFQLDVGETLLHLSNLQDAGKAERTDLTRT